MYLECRRGIAAIGIALMPLLVLATNANAQPTLSAQYAVGANGGIDRAEIGASFPTPIGGRIGDAAVNVALNADLAQYHATTQSGHSQMTDVGITPQLRFLLPDRERVQPYVDFGVGAHYLSAREIDDRRLGTRFQFGDYLGVGARFGEHHRFAASVRLLHESNCGTNSSNSGLTTVGLRFEYTLP